MYKRHETGRNGEKLACDFLIKKGYEIIKQNFRCKVGEIDIIAKDENELVFVEVKTRKQKEYGLPAEAVDNRKKRHMFFVAEYFLMINNIENTFCRFDIIEVYVFKNEIKFNHIKNCVMERPKKEWGTDECSKN